MKARFRMRMRNLPSVDFASWVNYVWKWNDSIIGLCEPSISTLLFIVFHFFFMLAYCFSTFAGRHWCDLCLFPVSFTPSTFLALSSLSSPNNSFVRLFISSCLVWFSFFCFETNVHNVKRFWLGFTVLLMYICRCI